MNEEFIEALEKNLYIRAKELVDIVDPNIKQKNKNRMPALMIAIEKNYKDIFKTLIKRGADVNATDLYGITALMNTSCEGETYYIKKLIKHGADVNKQNLLNKTALMYAAMYNQIENVRLLLKAGANPTIVDTNGRNALDYAKNKDIKKLLLKYIKLKVIIPLLHHQRSKRKQQLLTKDNVRYLASFLA
jgi:ankyrin repeat protein